MAMKEAVAVAILISEIMFNPASNEQPPVQTEWVELYNAGDEAVDLAGWYLQDEDGRTAAIPDGVQLKPGEALVLIPGEQSASDFRAAWDPDNQQASEPADDETDGQTAESTSEEASEPERRQKFQVVPLKGWSRGGINGLANSPGEGNEQLTLRRPDDRIADAVHYDDADPWPKDAPDGPSIYLLPEHLTAEANDAGAHWKRSKADVHGAFHANATEEYDQRDVGSPGVVETKGPTEEAAPPATQPAAPDEAG